MREVWLLLRNALFTFTAQVLTRASSALVFIIIARYLGRTEAGIYTLAINYTFIFMAFSFWGLRQLLVREVARDRARAAEYWSNMLVLRVILAVFSNLFLLLTLWALNRYSAQTAAIIMLMGLTLIPDSISDICQAVFMAYEEMRYLTTVAFWFGLIRIAGAGVLLHLGAGLPAVMWWFIAAAVIRMLINLVIVLRRFTRFTWRVSPRFMWEMMVVAFPFLFVTWDRQVGGIILSLSHPEAVVGLFGAAATILTALNTIPQAYQVALFPMVARLYEQGGTMSEGTASAQFRRLYVGTFRYILIFAIPAALGLTVLAREVLVFLYRAKFAEATPALQIVVWAFVCYFLTVPVTRLMIAANYQGAMATIAVVTLILNVGLNFWLAPAGGFVAVAVVRLLSDFATLAFSYFFTYYKIWRFNFLSLVVRPLCAAGGMAGALYLVHGLNLFVKIAIGAMVYAALLLLLRAVPAEDWHLARRALRLAH